MSKTLNQTISNIFTDESLTSSRKTPSNPSDDDFNDNSHVHDLIRTISQSTLSSTHRIFNYCDESELLGIRAGRRLVEQDEKLKNIDDELRKINDDLGEVEKNLKRLKSSKGCMSFVHILFEVLKEWCCGCCCVTGRLVTF